MKKTIKNISLILLLIVSILPLSGCGRKDGSSKSESTETMDNAFDVLSELEIDYRELEYSDDYINAMTQGLDETSKQQYKERITAVKTYEITISNPTDYYYNYVPVGFIFDKDELTQKDLESKEYTMILVPLTLAPGDDNVIHLTPDTELDNGDKITIAPYLLPFTESSIGSKVKDAYGSSSKNDSGSDSKDNNKDKKNNDKNKDKDSSDKVNNTTVIKSDSSENDSKDKSKDSDKDSKDSKDSSDSSSRDKKYIQAYISDEKSSQVVYPGDVEFGKPKKDEEETSEEGGLTMAGYTTEITNNSDATLKLSGEPSGANTIMFGMLSTTGDTIDSIQMTCAEKELKLKSGESGNLLTLTMGVSAKEPKMIFNGYGPAKGASDSDSKNNDKDSSQDSDKNKDNSKDSDKNKDKDKKSK